VRDPAGGVTNMNDLRVLFAVGADTEYRAQLADAAGNKLGARHVAAMPALGVHWRIAGSRDSCRNPGRRPPAKT